MVFWFRVDASSQIGTGHVVRCLTLANALRVSGVDCKFVCRDLPGNLNHLIAQHGYEVYKIAAKEISLEQRDVKPTKRGAGSTLLSDAMWSEDAEQTLKFIERFKTHWMIVDHYSLDIRWEGALRDKCPNIMVIDDLANRHHNCDLLLDQNLVAQWQDRHQDKVPKNCNLLLGPKFALLQSMYADLHTVVKPRQGPVRRILIYFGGADHKNLTSLAIATVKALPQREIALDVVVNSSNCHVQGIRNQAQDLITIHEDVPSLAPLMAEADLFVGAAGSTSWERCCLGLPSLVITLADNQTPIAAELHRLGLIDWLGHEDKVTRSVLFESLRSIVSEGLPEEWSRKCHNWVDGCGAARVSAQLIA